MMIARVAFVLVIGTAACQSAPPPETPEVESPAIAVPAPAPALAPVTGPPWDEARARGVTFRAVGNEPGWYVEVDGGDAPAMRLFLDYGERQIAFARTTVMPDPLGFRGVQGEVAAELRLYPERCADGMSGVEFAVRAELIVNGAEYRGCGQFLTP
jgi:uncharacterized membrane protein